MQNNQNITGIISPIIVLFPNLYIVWRDRERKKSPLKIRTIRKKGEIAKTELEIKTKKEQLELEIKTKKEQLELVSQAKMEKLKLELKVLEEETAYQSQMSK